MFSLRMGEILRVVCFRFRSELNQKFLHLERVLSLRKGVKLEKILVLSEAVQLIDALRKENHELKSLPQNYCARCRKYVFFCRCVSL